jgi:hypothetical protein
MDRNGISERTFVLLLNHNFASRARIFLSVPIDIYYRYYRYRLFPFSRLPRHVHSLKRYESFQINEKCFRALPGNPSASPLLLSIGDPPSSAFPQHRAFTSSDRKNAKVCTREIDMCEKKKTDAINRVSEDEFTSWIFSRSRRFSDRVTSRKIKRDSLRDLLTEIHGFH